MARPGRAPVALGLLLLPGHLSPVRAQSPEGAAVVHPEEVHLRNLRQLTFGGENAEGYFDPEGGRLIFQSRAEGADCDQQFVLDLATRARRRVSNGQGRTTCGYFLGGGRVLYASTHLDSPDCPKPPDFSQGYVWAMYPGYDLFTARAEDGGDLERLTATPGYDAEATVSPDGRTIVFTSARGGDLEIYTMGADGSDLRRLTHEPGYDGGPFFSPDGKRIVYRRDAPRDEAELARYQELLGRGLYRPGVLEIWVMDRDGSNKRQITRLGAASFAPFFHPDGRRILFSSNHPDPHGRNFDLWIVNDDGTGLERVTSDPSFDSFPMFSPDGRTLVFASNRGAKVRGETNLFLADWVETKARP
jgi:Tol biopolymer transport system component